jgi:hypothetical protein
MPGLCKYYESLRLHQPHEPPSSRVSVPQDTSDRSGNKGGK